MIFQELDGDAIGIDDKTQHNFRVYWSVEYRPAQIFEIIKWLNENCQHRYDRTIKSIGFEDRDDATLFYLRFA